MCTENLERFSVASHIGDNMRKIVPDQVIPFEEVRLFKEVGQRGKLDAYENLF
jgi:hypothetical protein